MRLLVVSNMYPTQENPVGGIFVHEQVKALRSAGVDARVVTGAPLWLSGRSPRAAVRRTRAEFAARRMPPVFADFQGVPVLRFNYFAGAYARPWLYPWIYRDALKSKLPAIAEIFPYDLVHTHTAFLDGRAGAAAARQRAVPMLLTEHTGPFSLVTTRRLFRAHTLAGMQAADRILAVSHALRRTILEQLGEIPPGKVSVIPNGVDTALFDPNVESLDAGDSTDAWRDTIDAAKTDLVLLKFILGLRAGALNMGAEPLDGAALVRLIDEAILTGVHRGAFLDELAAHGFASADQGAANPDSDEHEEPIRAIWVGHHVEVKRVDRLIDAFAIAARRHPSLRLTLVGNGPLSGAMVDRCRLRDVAHKVAFVPGASRRGVREHLSNSRFLVLSSETETFGVVGIEAMSMGLPVLATRCGGPQDYVTEETGLLVDNTAEDLAIGFDQMVASLGRFDPVRIRGVIRERFDFGAVARRLIETYCEMTKQHRPRVSAPVAGVAAPASPGR